MTTSVRSEATRSVIVVNSIDVLAIGQDGTVSILNPSATPSGSQILTAAQQPFTKEYVSPEQSIVNGSLISLLHNFGVKPKLTEVVMICKVAEYGYSVGDELPVMSYMYSAAAYGFQVSCNTTHVSVTTSTPNTLNKTTGAGTSITNANWRLVVRAWA